MSIAPYAPPPANPSATNLEGGTKPATSAQSASSATTEATTPAAYGTQPAGGGAAPYHSSDEQPTNRPLGVSDLTLRFTDGTLIKKNKIPLDNENPILFTVRFKNKPEGVKKMVMNVIISEHGKGRKTKGRSGKFFKNIKSTTYRESVPIVTDENGHSMTIQIGHAHARSSGFHGGDGPYDVYMSFSPDDTGTHDGTAGNGSQTEETLTYEFSGVRNQS